jgi:hypothetical protein
MALLVQETALAWTLAEAVKPHLSAIERRDVFIAIGAGETFAAIRGLVTSLAAKRIALRPDLAQQCVTWLHAYVGHKDERYFRRLIEEYLVPCSSHVPETVRVNRVPTTPIPGQLVAFARNVIDSGPRPMSASASGADPAERTHLVHHVERRDLVGLGERRVEHRIDQIVVSVGDQRIRCTIHDGESAGR